MLSNIHIVASHNDIRDSHSDISNTYLHVNGCTHIPSGIPAHLCPSYIYIVMIKIANTVTKLLKSANEH